MQNHYQVLGLNANGRNLDGSYYSVPEIKSAYRELSKIYHPDRPQGSKEKFIPIASAAEVLLDTKKRLAYDQDLGIRKKPEFNIVCNPHSEGMLNSLLRRYRRLLYVYRDDKFNCGVEQSLRLVVNAAEDSDKQYYVHPFYRSHYYYFLESNIIAPFNTEIDRLIDADNRFTDNKKKYYLIQLKKEIIGLCMDHVNRVGHGSTAIKKAEGDLHARITNKLQAALSSDVVNQERSTIGAFLRNMLGKLLSHFASPSQCFSLFHTRTRVALGEIHENMVGRTIKATA